MDLSTAPTCMSQSMQQTALGSEDPPDTSQELSITLDLGKLHKLYLHLHSIP